MRKLFFAVLFALMATPCYAQQLAQTRLTLNLKIPDFLALRVDNTASVTTENTRRVTVYVSANRTWQLTVDRACGSACKTLRWHVVSAAPNTNVNDTRVVGRNGDQMPVVIEYQWDTGTRPPEAADLRYLLSAG